MKKKILIIVLTVLLILGGSTYFGIKYFENGSSDTGLGSDNVKEDGKIEDSDTDERDGGKLCGDGICDDIEKKKELCPDDCNLMDEVENKESDLSSYSDYSGDFVLPDSFEVEENVAMISIHMEAGYGGRDDSITDLKYQEDYWPHLVDLIDLADRYSFHLTLNFNPQWATYILQDDDKLKLLRSWEDEGHEIAVHHHGPHHGGWNGYTNQQEFMNDPDYLGTIEDMMKLMLKLPASGIIKTVGIGGGTEDEENDWPEGIDYSTNGGVAGEELKGIYVINRNGADRIEISHGKFGGVLEISDFKAAIDTMENDVLGIVFHEKDYARNVKITEALFKLISESGLEVKSATEIISSLY